MKFNYEQISKFNSASTIIFFSIIFLLYLLPSFVQANYSENNTIRSIYLGLPITQTGDEPHYYITLYSLVNDGDIFLTNNYNNALYKNGVDLGQKKRTTSDRHTRVYDAKNKKITALHFINGLLLNQSTIPQEKSCITEISGHPMGLPLFTYLFLWPFKNTPNLEHLAIYLTLAFSLTGIIAFYNILLHFHKNKKHAMLFTIVLAFATQYWHYSKTFWAEPYLASFLIISTYLVIAKKNHFVAGLFLGFGFLLKYPFILAILPFYIILAQNYLKSNNKLQELKHALFFSIPLIVSLLFALYLNYALTNNPLKFNQINAVFFVLSIKGILNWLFNPTFGLFTFSPVLIFTFFGLKNFWHKNKTICASITLTIMAYFLFWALYGVTQNGPGGYSARYLTAIIPLIVLLFSFCKLDNKFLKTTFYILLFASIVINFLSAFAYPAFAGYSLQTALLKIVNYFIKMFI